ncbi:MAG TPA: PASTA domain-containing protein, partial [Bryobacteraceae bacterium]|nr:PASTA domain-containing protein [Bryobacteraceae bacterium]
MSLLARHCRVDLSANVYWLSVALLSLSMVALTQVRPPVASNSTTVTRTVIPHAASGPTFSEFATPTTNSSPTQMTLGPDGATWFIEASANEIGRVTAGGVIAETMVPTVGSGLAGITLGSDGALWFAESAANKIGRITTAGVITNEFPVTAGSQPTGIVSGPDGALWFTEYAGNRIGRLTTAGVLTETTLPSDGSQPLGITLGPDGCLWFAEYGASKIGRLDPSSGTIIETALTPGSGPQYITPGPTGSGPTGAIWFTERLSDKIGYVWPYSDRPPEFNLTEFSIPTPASEPLGITPGPDGSFWFIETATSNIASITTSGEFDEYPTPTPSSGPAGISIGPDGELWFSESKANKIVRAVVSISQPTFANGFGAGAGGVLGPDGAFWNANFIGTGGAITNIFRTNTSGGTSSYPVLTEGTGVGGITPGSDGALWFTESDANKIGRITTSGKVAEYPLPFVTGSDDFLKGITSGPDGALWFTETIANRIGRITLDGNISEYPIPTVNSEPVGIALGPDGALWFTESNGNIGRITTNAAITEYPTPTAQAGPDAITVGPDGAMWFVEYDANKIGRITTNGVITEYPVPTPNSLELPGIAAGPDGAVWFTEYTPQGSKVGRVNANDTIAEYEEDAVGAGIVSGPDGGLWLGGGVRVALPSDSNLNAVRIIGTNPSGLAITVDGNNYVAPQTFIWPVGSQHTISAASAASAGGAQYSFTNWSDGQPQSHTITTSAIRNVYIANYATVTAAVPNVVGLPQAAATLAIQNEGLVLSGIVWGPSSTISKGSVLSQNPAAGTIVDGGSTVAFVISSGPQGSIIPLVSGVISASAFGGFSAVAPGSWIEIYGSNLALDTRGWTGSDFEGNTAPNSLDGVKVSIGGQPAFVDYISSTQVNAQLPSNIPPGGTLQLTVANGNSTSATFDIQVNATEPGLLAPITFDVNGSQYVFAQLPDGGYALPVGSGGRPAHPGETVVMYGVGFGPVTPNIPAGQIVTQSNQLSEPLKIMFGQTPAQVLYFGLAPGFVGLYQFNVTVPSVPDSNLVPFNFTL